MYTLRATCAALLANVALAISLLASAAGERDARIALYALASAVHARADRTTSRALAIGARLPGDSRAAIGASKRRAGRAIKCDTMQTFV